MIDLHRNSELYLMKNIQVNVTTFKYPAPKEFPSQQKEVPRLELVFPNGHIIHVPITWKYSAEIEANIQIANLQND